MFTDSQAELEDLRQQIKLAREQTSKNHPRNQHGPDYISQFDSKAQPAKKRGKTSVTIKGGEHGIR